jgi:hypothetical protein
MSDAHSPDRSSLPVNEKQDNQRFNEQSLEASAGPGKVAGAAETHSSSAAFIPLETSDLQVDRLARAVLLSQSEVHAAG